MTYEPLSRSHGGPHSPNIDAQPPTKERREVGSGFGCWLSSSSGYLCIFSGCGKDGEEVCYSKEVVTTAIRVKTSEFRVFKGN